MSNVAKDFAQLISQSKSNKTGPYDTQATVKRVEGNTVWVAIPGGVDETPIDKTVNCSAGDKVQVRVSGGRAWITGNASAPPTDDTTAIKARTTANEAQVLAVDAKETADAVEGIAQAAQASATTAANAAANAVMAAGNAQTAANSAQSSATNANEYATRALNGLSAVESVTETLTWITAHGTMTLTTDVALDPTHVYFVVDPLGDYDVGGTHYSLVIDPDVDDIGTYYELSIDESLNNYVGTHLALDTEGLWLLPASSGTNKVLIATGAGSTYTTAGTYIIDSNGGTVASFRANGATIGEVLNGRTRTEIGTSGMQIIQRDGGSDTQIANLGYGEGAISTGTADAPFYSFGTRKTGTVAYNSSSTYSIGDICVYNGKTYVCIVDITTAEAWTSSHWRLLIGANSFTQGGGNIASGYNSHAQGMGAFSLGHNSHAEGSQQPGPEYTIAVGEASHAEGMATKSVGRASHSEGSGSKATGNASHAQNVRTIAASTGQTAVGKYNVSDSADTYAVIVGNGTADNARSNALTVDWSGNVNIASGAKYKINGTALSASDVSAVALSDKYTRSSAGGLDWTNQTEGDAKVIAKSALAFWNGSYNGTTSNLSRCTTGAIVGTNGATMTGQLKTSFKTSVAMGSYGSSQTTVDGLAGEIRYSSGAAGSASINTAYTKSGVTIPTGWYNFMYMPHRSGGNSGAADGDNANYGNLFLFGMNNTNGQFIVRISSGSVAEVVKLVTSNSTIDGLFKIVELPVTTSSSISAHGSYANATYTVPAADRPSGMTLAGIVGWGASNYRLSPSTAFVNGTHSISVTLANTSASSVSSGATVNFRLLYVKATSA